MIIVSPAKTLNDQNNDYTNVDIHFEDKTNYILKIMKSISKEDLGTKLKIKGKTLDITYQYYNSFNTNTCLPALLKYEGIVFKQIQNVKEIIEDKKKYNYLSNNIYILSTFYGIVSATNKIKSYRLDFSHTKIIEENLYSFWKQEVNNFISHKNPKQILNLCSNEYFKMIDQKQIKDTKVINLLLSEKISSTILKRIRGEILNYCIQNEIKDYIKLEGVKTKTITITKVEDNYLKIKLNKE